MQKIHYVTLLHSIQFHNVKRNVSNVIIFYEKNVDISSIWKTAIESICSDNFFYWIQMSFQDIYRSDVNLAYYLKSWVCYLCQYGEIATTKNVFLKKCTLFYYQYVCVTYHSIAAAASSQSPAKNYTFSMFTVNISKHVIH